MFIADGIYSNFLVSLGRNMLLWDRIALIKILVDHKTILPTILINIYFSR